MAIEYNFDIVSLEIASEHENLNNVVKTVVVRHTATNDNGVSCYVDMGIRLNFSTENFINFENLTKEDVLAWIQDVMWDFDEKIKNELNRKLEESTSSISLVNPPWNL